MKSDNKSKTGSNIAVLNRMGNEYYALGIDPSTRCIGVAIVSNKGRLILPGYVSRPRGTSKLSNTEAFEVMYEAFRDEFSLIGKDILQKVLAVSIEYPFLRKGQKSDPQATIKLGIFAGMVSSVISERFRTLGLTRPHIVYATYDEAKDCLGIQRKVCRVAGKNLVGHVVGMLYGISSELQESEGADGGYISRTRPEVLNQDALDAIAHAHYAVTNVIVTRNPHE